MIFSGFQTDPYANLRLSAPRRDHAIVMVKFAHDCLVKMKSLGQSLELELGPGTSTLTMRYEGFAVVSFIVEHHYF